MLPERVHCYGESQLAAPQGVDYNVDVLRAGFTAHQKKGDPLSCVYLHGAALFMRVGDSGSDLARCLAYSLEADARLSHPFDYGYQNSVRTGVAAVYAGAVGPSRWLCNTRLVPVMQAALSDAGRQHDLLSCERGFYIFPGQ